MTKKYKRLTNINDQLREAIDGAGITRYRIAQLSGVSEATISRYMAGGGLTLDNAALICQALNLHLAPRPQETNKPTKGSK